MYEGWGAGDFSGDVELFHPEVVFVIGPGFPDAATYHGLEGIAEYMHHFLEPWARIAIAAEELVAVGDNVLAAVHQRGVGEGSGIETEFRYFQVWSFRDGQVVRFEIFREREPALAAAERPA